MTLYFFDTSALVKRYHIETGSNRVDQLLADPEGAFVIANLTISELTSVFVRKYNEGIINRKVLADTLSTFSRDLIADFWILDLERSHIHMSMELIIKHNLRTLDSLQLAVLLSLQDLRPLFVSTDPKLNAAAQKEGMEVIDPEEETTLFPPR